MNDLIKNQYGPTFFKRWGEILGAVFIALRSALGISAFISVMALSPGLGMAAEDKIIEWSYPHGEKSFPDPASAAQDVCEYFLAKVQAITVGPSQETRIKSCKPGPVRRVVEGDLYFMLADYYAPALIEVESYSEVDGQWNSGIEIPWPMFGNCTNCYVAHLPNYQPSSAAPSSCQVENERKFKGEQSHTESVTLDQLPVQFSFAPEASNRNADYLTFNPLVDFIDQSNGSASEELACTEGFNELRFQGKAPWLNEVSVQYSYICGCVLKKGYDTVGELVITSRMDEKPDGVAAIQLHSATGPVTQFYQQSCTGTYRPMDNSRINLAETEEGDWALSASGQVMEVFNTAGQLVTVQNEQGQTFNYDTTDGQVNSIEAPSGAKITFGYTGGRLTSIEKPDKTTRTYLYEDSKYPNTLTGIVNENGVKNEAWKLDEKGRVVEHELAGGAEKTTTAFNLDGSTTLTNVLGKKTTFSFVEVAGQRKVSKVTGEPTANCLGSSQSYSYSPEGRLLTQTSWNGSTTKYQYDSLGREISRTEGLGTPQESTVQTCWDGTFYPPVRIIEPTRVTLFRYRYDNALLEQKVVKPRPVGIVDCSTKL
ncbi:MAG TPA: hypothetical protein PK129_09540 [Cellvibrionaceae bacterium]|nr:hypothetical protein [Cellvibrionaceae bacterium]